MSRKGGYKILNMQDLYFDTSVSKTVPGIYDLVSALESKVTLISGLNIDDADQDDMFVTWVNDDGTFKATIGDQTIAVASDDTVIITDGIIGGGGSGPTTVDAEDVTYDNSTSGLEAENVQAAIDELANREPPTPQIDADDIDYDNTDSGLEATNVQDAIDEVKGLIPEDSCANIRIYMNTSELTAEYKNYGMSTGYNPTISNFKPGADTFTAFVDLFNSSGYRYAKFKTTFYRVDGYQEYWVSDGLHAQTTSYTGWNPMMMLHILLYISGATPSINRSYSAFAGAVIEGVTT